MKKILCVDFDGVIHSYTSGWQGVEEIGDPPVPGAIAWLRKMITLDNGYEIAIYSSRSKSESGMEAMKDWLKEYLGEDTVNKVKFPTEKPPAYLTIDDRAICFRGTFPSIIELDNFKAWNK